MAHRSPYGPSGGATGGAGAAAASPYGPGSRGGAYGGAAGGAGGGAGSGSRTPLGGDDRASVAGTEATGFEDLECICAICTCGQHRVR
jgi:hypothetical protein